MLGTVLKWSKRYETWQLKEHMVIDRKRDCGTDLPGYVTLSVNVTVKQAIGKERDIRCGFGVAVHCA